mgnify:CR=1 FL=1
MRFKILFAVIFPFLCYSLFAQTAKTRAEFFKEFYGTYLNSTDIEVTQEETPVAPVDLSAVIKQLEARYNIDIPASEEAKFKTVEEVAQYVNAYLQTQSDKIEPPATVKPVKQVKPARQKIESGSWKFKLYGSYGAVETGGVTGGVTGNSGFNGNLVNPTLTQFSDMFTWEAGFALHPYGFNGKPEKSRSSWGLSYDYARFDHIGVDTVYAGHENDTLASRFGISLNFQQDLTGKNKARPKVGIYIMESVRLGVHTFGFIDPVLRDVNHLSYGIGLAQGIYFYIFDLKFYQNVAYSPDIMTLLPVDYPILRALDLEFGLRLGIALKF